MQVNVISATPYPVAVISVAAGCCYGKYDVNEEFENREKRVRRCFNNGHLSVFEHASITFRIEGISRACMAQLTRHRIASFCVESQRYCKYDLSDPDWYVTPEAFEQQGFVGEMTLESWYQTQVERAAKAYRTALESGIRPEDARFLLPESAKTSLVVTMNCRELFHFFDMRLPKSAQWEIRELAGMMLDATRDRSWEWEQIIDMYDGNGNE